MNEPDYERLLADIIEVAKEQPDKVFDRTIAASDDAAINGCIYVYDNGSPCCIVGQAWHRQERLDIDWFNAVVSLRFTTAKRNTKQFNTLVADEFGSTHPAINQIRRIQQLQDEGTSWGEAVAKVVGNAV